MTQPVKISRRTWLVGLVTVADAVGPWLVAMAGAYVALVRGGHEDPREAGFVIVAIACLFLVKAPRDLRSHITWRYLEESTVVLLRWMLVLVIVSLVGLLTPLLEPFDAESFGIWAVVTPVALVLVKACTRSLLRWLLLRAFRTRTAVIIGYTEPSRSLARRLAATPGLFTRVEGFFDDRSRGRLDMDAGSTLLGRLADVPEYARRHGVGLIFIALPLRHLRRVTELLDGLYDSTASVYYVPDIDVMDLIQAHPLDIGGVPVIAMRETPFHGYRVVAKRLADVILSLLMLVLLSPVILACALAIRLGSRGPVIFVQRRYGLDGEEIKVYKFRTMTVLEDDGQVRQASRDDSRVTAIGRILRRTSLDELPQLVNVLQGSMSLVGPRPHAVAHNEQYRKLIKGYMIRHKALPGITGLAQVNGCRGETATVDDMARRVSYDIEYLQNWSLGLDLRILLLTAVRMFRDEQAY